MLRVIEEVEAQWAKEEGKGRQRREKKRKEQERKRAGDGRRAGAEAASGPRGTSQDQPPDAGDTADALAPGVMELAGTDDEPAPGSGAAQGACGPASSGAAELLMAVAGVTESRARELLETSGGCVERAADLHFSQGATAEPFAAEAGQIAVVASPEPRSAQACPEPRSAPAPPDAQGGDHRRHRRDHPAPGGPRRRGIRFAVNDGSGVSLPVGPIRVSTRDSVEEVLARVFKWLQEDERKLTGMWPHGVLLLVNGQPLQRTAELWEAKAGQIGLVAAPVPPPAASSGRDGRDGDHPAGSARPHDAGGDRSRAYHHPAGGARPHDADLRRSVTYRPTIIQQEVPVPKTRRRSFTCRPSSGRGRPSP